MAADLLFSEDDMSIDEAIGYPKAYSKLCRDPSFGPYSHGPPFTFTPYDLQHHEASRAKELDQMFPIIDTNAKPTAKPKIFVNLLWKQLNHLGNAGFDPETFRVDPYGNVLYYHADSASPLAWDIDHWFPCSRGGLTVPSNLRLLQWQVCKKKHNKLEFLIPWWDLQLGISINQFLSIFASSNSDFRHRSFSLLFCNGESEELNASQTVDSHSFPQHFRESKKKLGLAPAAVVVSRRECYDASSTLQSLDINRRQRSNSPIIAARKLKTSMSKENENPDMVTNPYQAIVMARDSLRQREETAKKQTEIEKLDEEVNELRQKNEEEKAAIQDLDLVLIKKRRRAEKCRRLAEAQSSYRAMLEKMIRDAMHQSVVYKEQVRLNQAASNALMARLEAQKAICDSSERELHKKFKQRDELEKQTRPEWEQARKRSRMEDTLCEEKDEKTVLYLPGSKPRAHLERKMDDNLLEEKGESTVLYLPGINPTSPLHKELRVFLEEEQKAHEAGLSLSGNNGPNKLDDIREEKPQEIVVATGEDEHLIKNKLQNLRIEEDGITYNIRFPADELEGEEDKDDESRKQRGKGNVEKWLHMLLEGTDQNSQIADASTSKTDEIIRKMNLKYPQKEIKISRFPASHDDTEGMEQRDEVTHQQSVPKKEIVEVEVEALELESDRQGKKEETTEVEARKTPSRNPPYRLVSEKSNANELDCEDKVVGRRSSFEVKERKEKSGKEKGLTRCDSARSFRRTPSSPSIILGMRKGVDFLRKKPSVNGDDDAEENSQASNNFFKSSIKTIKKAVKI